MNTKNLIWIMVILFGVGLISSCTDLVTVEKDSRIVVTSAGGTTNSNAVDLLQTSYNDLGAFTDQAGIYSMTEHTTDELIPPTRGVDWSDNGVWRSLYTHTWDPAHSFIQAAWNGLNQNAYKTQLILDASNATAQQKAEAKFLRAFNRFYVMDFWGVLPDRQTSDPDNQNPIVHPRPEAFALIIADLEAALPDLPTTSAPISGALNPTATKAAANALLSRLYLNKGVYTAADATGSYTFDAADMTKCIQYCDAVTADGYTLAASYFDNFAAAGSSEVLLTSQQGSPQNRVYMTLHYNQNPAGWNGFATLADFYGKFTDPNDQRLGAPSPIASGAPYHGITLGFLRGQQYDDNDGELTDTRTSQKLKFTDDVPLSGAATAKGIRVMKYHPGTYGKYVLMRYGEVHLNKAEAILRGGTATTGNTTALAQINELRTARGAAALGAVTLDDILDERGRELYWEGLRRTDLIRFGKFNNAWAEKGDNVDAFRVLFTIPQQALDSNPNLAQNPGY